ncbi:MULTISPECIES: mercury(II) reductase [Alteromonadales]|uniref:Mercuric reductase n=2 Tax=Shewanella TaxID=22 RepID=A0ABQ2RCM1_9GAMM|nr:MULTISPECIES: mercury(II) reductase [Shewanella]MCL1103604.1 mercury(II) reductase [Shewanella saliphila]GGP71262.1 mercuric reductase [Shewanella saliphila]GGQ22547.1 mercuric reductase [Shewanella litoralis]
MNLLPIRLSIQGMTCPSCVKHIKEALDSVEGVIKTEVYYENALAYITTRDDVNVAELILAINALGYIATELKDMTIRGNTNQKEDYSLKQQVAIIGSGSGAFACAIKAAEGGAKVTLIESSDVIGGCCVNVGCVPSKILIRAAQLAQQQRSNPFAGLENHTPALSRALLSEQQTARVEELRTAKYQNILDNNPALSLIKGFARFNDANTLIISNLDGSEQILHADKILIATGSTPTIPQIDGLAGTPYWTSTEALFAKALPHHLIVIGSSVIALEIAQAYRRLGSEVTVLARHSLLYAEDPLLGEKLTECFQKEGINVLNHTQATSVSYHGEQFTLETNAGTVIGDQLLISTGRNANTSQLNLAAIGIKTNEGGEVIVNEWMETNISGIYAAGDCSNMPQFVYVAAAAGSRAGVNMTGGNATLDLTTMPAVIFTDPQVATVGLTEFQAKAQGIDTDSRVLGMENVPRALANFETDGFIKLVVEKKTGRIIGAQILAHEGGEIIQSAALAIRNRMTVTELADQLFPYLTMVEGLKLCAQTFNKDVKELSCCAG